MTQILLCNSATTPNAFESTLGADTITGIGCLNPNTLNAYSPYLLTDNTPTLKDFAILNQFSNAPVTKELTNMSLSYGSDNTLALAEISDRLKSSGIGIMGATTSIYNNRLASFTGSVKSYQSALLDYRDAMKSGGANKVLAKQTVTRAFQKMQTGFQHELKAVTGGIKANRKGIPITNATRAMNIAKSSRNTVKLEINSQVQASQLARFGKSAKLLGNGLVVIDFASRVGSIQNSYSAGGNWERELFIESSSFALSGIAGSLAISFIVVATPVGWVGLVIGAAAISMGTNYIVKENAGSKYDQIIKWLGV
ncbi:MAG: hypothetical protein QM484_01460 [Woeseiaceae bacterium]